MTLLQQVAAGKPMAMQQCIDAYGGLVWTLAKRMAGQEAEDAVQEIFLAIWKSAARFDPQSGSEATFVAMIARRRLIDRLRMQVHKPDSHAAQLTDQDSALLPLTHEYTDVASAAAAIEQLSPEQQTVIGLSLQRGLAHEQIANATGLPLGTVKTHIRRGLMKIREVLESGVNAGSKPERQEVKR